MLTMHEIVMMKLKFYADHGVYERIVPNNPLVFLPPREPSNEFNLPDFLPRPKIPQNIQE